MGRKKRASPANVATAAAAAPANKKQKSNERYLVKKYRPDRHYAAMDAFVKYTKAHRMSDAAYVRCDKGGTPEKPFCFSTRVGGTDLGWGRGKTREAAMDAACRAAFALVSAHGYNHFPVDDDCLMTQPVDVVAAPPPPPGFAPPLPPGAPPPLPLGAPPPPLPPPPVVAPVADLIPQPKALPEALPVASSLSVATTHSVPPEQASAPVSISLKEKTKLKGGLTLVYDGDNDLSMEEQRASLGRYRKLLQKAQSS